MVCANTVSLSSKSRDYLITTPTQTSSPSLFFPLSSFFSLSLPPFLSPSLPLSLPSSLPPFLSSPLPLFPSLFLSLPLSLSPSLPVPLSLSLSPSYLSPSFLSPFIFLLHMLAHSFAPFVSGMVDTPVAEGRFCIVDRIPVCRSLSSRI